jgi:NodT family efflux transporter outer membrane factor (OMF) lipoprotein
MESTWLSLNRVYRDLPFFLVGRRLIFGCRDEINTMKWLAALSITLTLNACQVNVKTVESPVMLPTKFSASGFAKQPDNWWQSFNDPDLTRLCEQALSTNFSILAAYARLEQAKAVAVKTGAELIPQVNAITFASKGSGSARTFDDLTLGLGASYEIDLWGRLRSARNAAELDAHAASEDLDSAAISLTAEIATIWFKLIEQRQQLKLLDKQIQVNQNNVDLVTVRFKGAQATAADVFQQQQLLESVIGNRYFVEASVAVLQNRLAVLLGKPPGLQHLPDTLRFPDMPPLPATGLTLELMQRRPDVRKAYFTVQAADQRIASAIADRFPKLSLSASADVSSPGLQSLLNNWLATVAGNLVLPVIDGRRRIAEVDRNRGTALEAMNNYAATLLGAVEEVENALAQERQQQLAITNLATQVTLATQASTIIRMRYINGAIDFLRVLSALLSQQSLERNLITARQQLLEFRINLYRSLAGRINGPDLVKTVGYENRRK